MLTLIISPIFQGTNSAPTIQKKMLNENSDVKRKADIIAPTNNAPKLQIRRKQLHFP
jgi:hypothetical protein